jgi:hypothetical protein
MTAKHHEKIRTLAHQIWEDEGRPEGRHLDHWARAEEMVTSAKPAKADAEKPAKPDAEKPAKPAKSDAAKPSKAAKAAAKPKASAGRKTTSA